MSRYQCGRALKRAVPCEVCGKRFVRARGSRSRWCQSCLKPKPEVEQQRQASAVESLRVCPLEAERIIRDWGRS